MLQSNTGGLSELAGMYDPSVVQTTADGGAGGAWGALLNGIAAQQT